MPVEEPHPDAEPVLIWTNTGTPEEAEAIAMRCVASGLAAAVNMDEIDSLYRWEGAVHRAHEYRLCIKAVGAAVEGVREVISELHGYSEPAILVTPVAWGSPTYLDWLRANSGGGQGG